MEKPINVLIFPCGAENAIEAFIALKDVVNINVIGASGKSDHGEYLFNQYIGNVPLISSDAFDAFFITLLREFQIDVVIPTHDDVVLKLAEMDNPTSARFLVHGLHQAMVSRSKKETYQFFRDYSFVPETFQCAADIPEYPVFVKPDKGQGGRGAFVAHSREEVENVDFHNFVVSEFLPGDELTVDCLTDYQGNLVFAGPRKRDRVSNGISVRTFNVEPDEQIMEIAHAISAQLKLNGLWYFQLKKDQSGAYKLMEISLRISGSMNLFRNKGINFPLLAVYNALHIDTEIIENPIDIEVDRALFNRYRHNFDYQHIYIDFDETITRNGLPNPEVILFLYNSLNKGKKLYLLTRHEHDIHATLDKLKIHPGIFEEIFHLKNAEKKSAFIRNSGNAIFIDNAYRERKAVHNDTGIPVFDVDAVSLFIDWRN
jgi:hypothetical protein